MTGETSFGKPRWLPDRRLLVAAVVLALVWIGVAWLVTDRDRQAKSRETIHAADDEARLLADVIALDLRGVLSTKKAIAATLADAPYVRQFVLPTCGVHSPHRLANMPTAAANSYLTTVAHDLGLTVLFVGDAKGHGIASAHADTRESAVGRDFSDRDYFRGVREGAASHQYARGQGIGGIYFAAPVMNAGRFCGFVVLKADTTALSAWLSQADAILADENGVIIGSRDQGLALKTLPGSTAATLPRKVAGERYGRVAFEPIGISPLLDRRYPNLKRVEGRNLPQVIQQVSIPEYGLQLLVTQPVGGLREIDRQHTIFFLLSAVLGLLVIATTVLLMGYVSYVRNSGTRFQQIAERLEAAASAGIVGVWDWDVVNDSLVWDKVMYKLYGLREWDFAGAYDAWMHALHPEDKKRLDDEIQAALRGERQYAAEFRVVWPDGSIHYLKALSHTTFDKHGKPLRMVGVNYDLTEQKEIQHELDKLAYYDRLTKLPNRRLLEDRLDQAIALAKREGRKVAVLFVDLDRFKPVNDTYGHETGDWVLQQVADRMVQCVRASDTAARIGGDEFIVLLQGTADLASAGRVAEKIRAALAQPFPRGSGSAIQISASIGVVMYPDHAGTSGELLRFGDEAMYLAKKGGRDAVHVFAGAEREGASIIRLHWAPEYASGNPAIDEEHQEFFRQANRLLDLAVARDTPPAQIEQAFDALISSMQAHFSDEEAMLRAHGYEGLNEQARQHRQLLDQAVELRAQSGAAEVPITGLVHFLASDVVASHILGEDRKFFGLIRQAQQAG